MYLIRPSSKVGSLNTTLRDIIHFYHITRLTIIRAGQTAKLIHNDPLYHAHALLFPPIFPQLSLKHRPKRSPGSILPSTINDQPPKSRRYPLRNQKLPPKWAYQPSQPPPPTPPPPPAAPQFPSQPKSATTFEPTPHLQAQPQPLPNSSERTTSASTASHVHASPSSRSLGLDRRITFVLFARPPSPDQ